MSEDGLALDPSRLYLARRLPRLPEAIRALAQALRAGGGGRLGESAVVSTCVHLVDASSPGEVTIVRNRDAGRVFYDRARPREVVHADVFHAVGEVSHRLVAAALLTGERAWRAEAAAGLLPGGLPADAPGALLDFVDIQTGTGGGRASGSLRYGRGIGLRRAHLNHVHLAALLPASCVGAVPYLVAAVEEAVALAGLEVRAVERVLFREAAEGAADGDDLAPYADVNDSLIRRPRRELPAPGEGWDAALFDMALWLARALGGVEEARALLDAAARGARVEELVRGRPLAPAPPRGRGGAEDALLDAWVRDGLFVRDGGLYRLGPGGYRLREYLALHAGEVAAALRVASRHLGRARRRGRRAWEAGLRGPRRRVEPAVAPGGRRWGELAVAETVAAAALRRARERATPRAVRTHASPPSPRRPPRGLRLAPEDVRVLRRERPRPLDLLLLLDASASMAGARMRAAQELALRLLLGGRDRVAIVSFQDRGASLRVPLTRNRAALERGIADVRPFGLTPLAAALETAVAYLRVAHARRPLVVLITDGIPTVSRTAAGPLEDALRAAELLGASRIPFTCVGLEPNRGYLAELAERARGTLYVVEELEGAQLMEIVEGERRRHRRGAARA